MRIVVRGEPPSLLLPYIDTAIDTISAFDEIETTARKAGVRFKADFDIEPHAGLLQPLNRAMQPFRFRISRISNMFRLSYRPADAADSSEADVVIAWHLGDENCETPPSRTYVLSRLGAMREIAGSTHSPCAEGDIKRSIDIARFIFSNEHPDETMTMNVPNATHGAVIRSNVSLKGWHEHLGDMSTELSDAMTILLRDIHVVSVQRNVRRDGLVRIKSTMDDPIIVKTAAPSPLEAIAVIRNGLEIGPGPHLRNKNR